jgi:hypothetical protein
MKESILRPYLIGAFFLLGFLIALSPQKAKAEGPTAIRCDYVHEKLDDAKRFSKVDPKDYPFEVIEIKPQVFFLHFKDQRSLARTMVRFQEFYESPEYSGRIFSRSEFQDWYRGKKGVFDYYSEWDGFNVPGYVLKPFYEGKFPHLTAEEKMVLEALKKERYSSFYVIATADNSGINTLAHEIAHSMYYLNPAYREEVNQVLASFDMTPVKKYLKDTVGDYHDHVLTDEVHAWLMHDTPWMTEHGFDVSPYREITAKLQAIYNKYNK